MKQESLLKTKVHKYKNKINKNKFLRCQVNKQVHLNILKSMHHKILVIKSINSHHNKLIRMRIVWKLSVTKKLFQKFNLFRTLNNYFKKMKRNLLMTMKGRVKMSKYI